MTTAIADQDAMAAMKQAWDIEPTLTPYGPLLEEPALANPPAPYATCKSEESKPQQFYAPLAPGSGYNDWRKVTLIVRGTKPEVVTAGGLIKDRFDWLPKLYPFIGPPTFLPPPPTLKTLNYFDGMLPKVRFKLLRPLADPTISSESTRKNGEIVWMVTAVYELWTTRLVT